jgi:TupA-like ATPgrasp
VASTVYNASPRTSPSRSALGARMLLKLILPILPMAIYRIMHFCYYQGRLPKLLAPQTFNDKVCHRMIFRRDPQMTLFADKLHARQFVRERLGEDSYLTPLYAIFGDATDIQTLSLPHRFVLKPNHAAGWIYLHNGTSQPDRDFLEALSRKWLTTSYYTSSKEWQYKDIEPRILIEKFLGDELQPPKDFKFLCIDGVVRWVQLDVDRYTQHRRNMYDRSWNLLDFQFGPPQKADVEFARPEKLDLMIEIAEKLSTGTKLLSVDLYCVGNEVHFGEFTNYPEGGMARFSPDTWDLVFGKMLGREH